MEINLPKWGGGTSKKRGGSSKTLKRGVAETGVKQQKRGGSSKKPSKTGGWRDSAGKCLVLVFQKRPSPQMVAVVIQYPVLEGFLEDTPVFIRFHTRLSKTILEDLPKRKWKIWKICPFSLDLYPFVQNPFWKIRFHFGRYARFH